MVHLLHLTRSHGAHGETIPGTELTLNAFHILMIEDVQDRDPGNSKILMSNGKTFFVEESQADIREMANTH